MFYLNRVDYLMFSLLLMELGLTGLGLGFGFKLDNSAQEGPNEASHVIRNMMKSLGGPKLSPGLDLINPSYV